jgi:arginine deiminase
MATTTSALATKLGVHAEVGKLRKVTVCRPGLAHLQLTPANRMTCPIIRAAVDF